jgi:hypothetical protein
MAIKSFGLFWRRDEVDWNPGKGVKGGFRLLGRSGENLPGLRVANFREQLGIYILYGNHGPYYVGLTKKGELGGRLKNHLTDEHADEWDRFSWFGFRTVLKGTDDYGLCNLKDMAETEFGNPISGITDLRRSLSERWGYATKTSPTSRARSNGNRSSLTKWTITWPRLRNRLPSTGRQSLPRAQTSFSLPA